MKSKYLILIIIAITILFSACSNSYCPKSDTQSAIQNIGSIIIKFDAYSNNNFDLNQMQIIRNELSSLNVPECLTKTKNFTINAMDYMILGTRGYLNNESDWINHINDGLNMIKTAENEMARIYACMPDCKP